MSSISEGGVPDDVTIAAVASVCTVALHLLLARLVAPESSLLVRLAPLGVYFVYTFVHHGSGDSPFDTPRNWALLTVAVTAAVVGFYLL
ncbi:hypothetical protein ACFO0N_13355 [Halobium salinum]|uniref:DUF8049 domain-containing protein n=1 Tax=Halobium salinum TaxID=1364940 RepID=A0ABD5PDE2_9EURY|nr:hypothetical protein [Halobium salinum]